VGLLLIFLRCGRILLRCVSDARKEILAIAGGELCDWKFCRNQFCRL